MSNFKKRIIAVAAIACIAAVPFTGCSDSSSSSKNGNANISDDVIKNANNGMIEPFQVIDGDSGSKVNYNGVDINAPDPVAPTENSTSYVVVTDAKGENVTEYVPVTDDKGEKVTEIVTVTEAGGEKATESDGKDVTSAVEVTEAVTVTEIATSPTKPADYQSKTSSKYILWMNLEKDVDYDFQGKFVKMSFKVKDDAPEGDYQVTINPDVSTVAGKSLNKSIKVFNGLVRVGGSVEAQDVSNVDGPVIYADKVSAKPGETVDFYLNFDKNPGCAAMMICFAYDSNALECISPQAYGDFAEVAASHTQQGTSPAQ